MVAKAQLRMRLRCVELFCRTFGKEEARPLVILHGLLGSSRNWQAAATALGERFRVFALDLRNHGESAHESPHSYEAMVTDVIAFLDEKGLSRAILLGHSMGGKVAMKIACEHPDRVDKLLVVDILPIRYSNTHDNDFDGMRSLDLRSLKTRTEAESLLEPFVKNWAMRKFLLTNLARAKDGEGFRWMVNLEAIVESRSEIEGSPLNASDRFDGDTLFLMGGRSAYFVKEKMDTIKAHFSSSALEVISESGHNPHFETRESFVDLAFSFLD